MKKYVGIVCLAACLLLTGCGNKELKSSYKKMTKLDSFNIDYRLYGTYNNENINDIIKISYKDGKVTASVPELDNDDKFEDKLDDKLNNRPGKEEPKEKVDLSKYNDAFVYLLGLDNISKEVDKKEETIGDNKYQVYDVKVRKSAIEEIIKYTNVDKLEVKEDKNAKIYIDKDGYVYRVIYELDAGNKLFLNVNYFGMK